MFLREIALSALRRAGIIHGESAPADRFALAMENVSKALRYYSDSDTISCFADHCEINLEKETTIGLPALKRGIRLHDVSTLPTVSTEDVENGSVVPYRDVYAVGGTFYWLNDEMTFESVLQGKFCDTCVDIYLKDISRIVAMYDGDDLKLDEKKLANFFGCGSGIYACVTDGEGRLKIYVKNPGKHHVVYSRSMVFNENSKVDLTASQLELIEVYAANQLARTSEKKAQLSAELKEAISDTSSNAMEEVIPTRSEV